MKLWIQTSTLILTTLLVTSMAWADVTRRIVIKDETPEAYRSNRLRAEKAQERLESKRQRQHEIELANIEAKKAIALQRLASQPKVAPIKRKAKQRASFFNGGRFTGFSNPVIGGFGFGPGFGPSFAYGYHGFNGRRGFRRGFRRGHFQRGGRRGGFRRGGFRGNSQSRRF